MYALAAKALLFKPLWYALGILALLWGAYTWIEGRGFDRGVASTEHTIGELTTKVNGLSSDLSDARGEIEAAQKTGENATAAHVEALATQKAGYEKLLSDQKASLNLAETKLKKYQNVLNYETEVKKYVTPAADRAPITDGFLWVHNLPLLDSPADAQALGFPPGGPADVDAPSGVAASTVAATVGRNYATCRYNETLVREWQAWYPRAKAVYDEAVARAARYEVVRP